MVTRANKRASDGTLMLSSCFFFGGGQRAFALNYAIIEILD